MENINDFTGGYLPLEPVRNGFYKIVTVTISKELDLLFRKLAIATVVTKSGFDLWDGNTMHNIELKHCYNWASQGPNITPYTELVGKIINIINIQRANHGDLDIVKWELLPSDIRM